MSCFFHINTLLPVCDTFRIHLFSIYIHRHQERIDSFQHAAYPLRAIRIEYMIQYHLPHWERFFPGKNADSAIRHRGAYIRSIYIRSMKLPQSVIFSFHYLHKEKNNTCFHNQYGIIVFYAKISKILNNPAINCYLYFQTKTLLSWIYILLWLIIGKHLVNVPNFPSPSGTPINRKAKQTKLAVASSRACNR